jgi:hypothetical protein
MTNQYRIFAAAGAALLMTFMALNLNVPDTHKGLSPAVAKAVDQRSRSANNDFIAQDPTAPIGSRLDSESSSQESPISNGTYQTRDIFVSTQDLRKNAGELTPEVSDNEPEGFQAHIPLAFLNYAGVLQPTEPVVAALQKIQQDFIDSTGATTANPADPVFADSWNHFQPTADERFYAIFGIEAYDAVSIMEVRQTGHF